MEESVSSTSPRQNIGVILWTQLQVFLTQRNEVRNSIRWMKYLELAFNSNSVNISGKPLYGAGRGVVQLNASAECLVSSWTDQSDRRILRPYSFSHYNNMSKSNLNEAGLVTCRWLPEMQ